MNGSGFGGACRSEARGLAAGLLLILSTAFLCACEGGRGREQAAAAATASDAEALAFQEQLLTQLLDASAGDVITIPAGRFSFNRSLSLTADGVTIRGAGMDETVLSFAGQVTGAEGLLVTGSNFTIEDLAIEDTIGDALKINEAENVIIRRVRTEWTGGPATDNGAYGLYPVQTKNVLIEDCVAIGASDAGIYVGQSQQVVVRGSRAEYNVAGIEIENTRHADVYDNVATNNTGGILVFNMPNLPQRGSDVRVFNNQVFANNTDNFGIPGTAVASVPAGSGIVVNSHDRIEIFDNEVRDNRTANVIISSMFSSGWAAADTVADFDPYPEQISLHGNRFSGGGNSPDGLDLKALKTLLFGLTGSFPDVIWDGYVKGAAATAELCVADAAVEVLNVDGPNGNDDPRVERAPHDCTLEPLAPVELEPFSAAVAASG